MKANLVLPSTYATEEAVKSLQRAFEKTSVSFEKMGAEVKKLTEDLDCCVKRESRLRLFLKWLTIVVVILGAVLAGVIVQQGQTLDMIEKATEILRDLTELLL